MSVIDDAAALIRASNCIAIVTHVSPDPDAIGSLLALGLALQSMGKQVEMLCDDPFPAKMGFLPGSDQVRSSPAPGFHPDLLVGIDSSDPQRLGDSGAILASRGIPILNIDHHVTNLNYGTVNLVVPQAASATEALIPLLDSLGVVLTPDIATGLAAGLVGDTRSFSTSSVTPETLTVAARLVETGVDLADITERVFSRRTLSGLRLWGLGLADLHLEDGILWAAIPLASRRALGLPEMSDTGLTNLLLSAEEATISAVFTELADGQVDVSFRARPGYDVAGVALSLGGGGHPLAAGCIVEGALEDVIRRVVTLLRSQTAQPAEKG